ncbi:LOW QUALITY PROTEIN: zinc finger protein 704-like [Aquila chrysaetos chrysaetos]|uniref:LOW QUALITY PROTEIN: zinc finger protein 704-like n=1 Tax=Aquila chrysaetos chrysaetos TaxID=223781 RepID=UPI001177204D|nr:LOW QUALITY PROTEIN: zinc finger protein 704-like [Aquila chrysaetos chrysaetos]
MQARRLAKRSSMGSRRLSAGPAAAQADGVRPPKAESAWRPPRREGSAAALEEEDEDEDVVVGVEEEEEEEEGGGEPPPPAPTGHGKGPLRGSLKPVEVSLGGSMTVRCISHSSLFCVTCKLAEDALCPIVQFSNEDLEQDWIQD